ncbi:hypothetical protein H634G_01697 [Metarhizium anisopliae BRIP 53293]|uniref:Uncharacterized protein n=1 Tax=Metarhizium anisopliae BRIP 53293 TaxID=1291518 RepID=A0A0D9PBU2_METAN|nr:hypothetical protein H634G_01697 [Metarhizium anisopliae BRIP 53293]KJK87659.1 hypothetical protein H633G_08487 [Metarhizium anisopliae BRIP 53284]
MRLLLLPLFASAAAAQGVVSATVYSQPNFGGVLRNVIGFGCVNLDDVGFKIESIELRRRTFCYAYGKVNCAGASIYMSSSVGDLWRYLTMESAHCFDAS